MAATSNFSAENVIISTRIRTTYKAVLPDGSVLAIKRLYNYKLSKRQFYSKINKLMQLRHPNLTPLLCFCMVEEEKLLICLNNHIRLANLARQTHFKIMD
ncbi:hypothetical protein LguiB_008652 [Lonicera macranthoides]